MNRREFVGLMGGAAAWPLVAWAQQIDKVWRIGILETVSETLNGANLDAFRHGLQEYGYVEGKNLHFEYRSADGQNERFSTLAEELVRLNVDLILTRGTPASIAAKRATEKIPIVMAALGEPLMLVGGLLRPGANLTGLSSFVTELHAKRLEILKQAIPSVVGIATLLNMSNPVTPPQWDEIEKAAELLGIAAKLFDVRSADDLVHAMALASTQRMDAVLVGTGALIQDNASFIVELSLRHGLPTMHVSKEYVTSGGMMSYGPSYPDLYRRAAGYVDRIIKGANAGSLPIEQPNKFELAINLRTARAIGITIPPSLLARADEVIE
jgi:putative ABC transport system substrate-binding protein